MMLSVSLCYSFLIVSSVYSSIYFVLCLVYLMLPVSLCCSFLINQEWTTQRHCQHRIHKTQDKINTRVNRRDNQELTTQRHWQHRIHKTQDKLSVSLCYLFLIVTSVYSSVYFVMCLVYPMLSVSLCCLFLIVPSVYSSVYFVLCLVYPMLWGQSRINNTETLITSDTQDTWQNKH
jgi:uncharacterized membrane protein (DUF106 family)